MSAGFYNKDSMFAAGKTPWHRFGVVTKECQRAEEAIRVSNMGWDVIKQMLARFQPYPLDNLTTDQRNVIAALQSQGVPLVVGHHRVLTGQVLTCRDDIPFADPSGDLGIVGVYYAPISNTSIFNALDRVVGGVGAMYETAGSIFNGKQVFILAKWPTPVTVGQDTLQPYLLAMSSHDGTSALQIKFTMIRVVCQNTMAMADAETRFARSWVKHNLGNLDQDGKVKQVAIDRVSAEIGQDPQVTEFQNATEQWINQELTVYQRMAGYTVSGAWMSNFAKVLFPAIKPGAQETRATNKQNALLSLFNGQQPGNDQDVMRQTAYRVYNSVTHYSDHVVSEKQTTSKATGEPKDAADRRFVRIMAGDLRNAARDIILEGIESNGETLAAAVAKIEQARTEAAARQLVSC